jgi:hypothetical protein
MKHNLMTKRQRKTQEGHLKEGKTAKPTNDTKNGKPKRK